MKKAIYLLFLFPLVVGAQYDFDTRYFTINASSLPEIEDLSASSFSLEKEPFIMDKLRTFQMNAENYRQPIDMVTAINDSQRFIERSAYPASIQQQLYGFSVSAGAYQSDGTTTVKNIAYKEMRGLDFLDACPPFGICGRCAPYRVGRGY